MFTTGLLVIADIGLTLTWQEPVTWYLASRAQAQLAREVRADQRLVPGDFRAAAAIRDPRARLAAIAARARSRARPGHAVGRIEFPSLGKTFTVVEGTDTASLEKGPGHYRGSPFPGEGGTVAIAGHRTTYLAPFRSIDRLRVGDQVLLVMPYATMTYSVTGTRVVLPTDLSILKPVGYEQLVLSACHPLYSASHRIIAFGRLVGTTLAEAPGHLITPTGST